MNAMSAVQAVAESDRTLQTQGDVLQSQLSERTAGRPSFSIDLQSPRIIIQAQVAPASRDSARIAAYPQDLPCTRLEQMRQIRDQSPCAQQREGADLRTRKRLTHASRRRQQGPTPRDDIVDENHAFRATLEGIQSEGFVVPRYAWAQAFRGRCRLAHSADSPQSGPRRAAHSCFDERAR